MKIAYFDCFSGISGDMTLGALIDAGADLAMIQAAIQSMGLPNLRLEIESAKKNGFRASQLRVVHPPEHAHRHLHDICEMIDRGTFSDTAKELAKAIFYRIAVAEARVHGMDIQSVHFHEVGAIDSIADIVGVSVAWDAMEIETAYASRIPVGAGQIEIAHGLVSVPAPATAEILQGIPLAPTDIQAELTTPTGAAIIAELVTGFGPLPSMQVDRIGYGAGNRNLRARPNMLRVLIGTAIRLRSKPDNDVLVMETNLDDTTGEEIGFAIELLFQAGAVDVFTTAIQMKKGRPGTLLTVLAKPEDRSAIEAILFQQTSTLGIRYSRQQRTVLPRTSIHVDTPWGMVRGKLSTRPDGSTDFSPEYEDCRKLAKQHGLRLASVYQTARQVWERTTRLSIPTSERAGSPVSIELSPEYANREFDISAKQALEEIERETSLHSMKNPASSSSRLNAPASAEHDHSHDHSHDHDDGRDFPKSRSYHSSSGLAGPHFDFLDDDNGEN